MNKCSKGRLHKCFVCKTFGCKSFLQRNESTQKVNTNMTATGPNHIDILEDILGKGSSLSTKLISEGKHLKKHRRTYPQVQKVRVCYLAVSSSMFGSPIDFSTKNILWTPVESVRRKLPCPLDMCCSVSLVSQEHAKNL